MLVTDSVPGGKSREIIALQRSMEGSIVSYPVSMPIAFERAKGSIIEDVDGNRFIDLFAGCGVLNLGHTNPYILEFVKRQEDKLIHALDFPTENKIELIRNILAEFPEPVRVGLKVAFCASTGSDAVEAAIKLSKHFTGRESIIAFQGSYHGMTSGALAATSNVNLRNKLRSLVPNIHFIPYSYCYRCAFNKTREQCDLDCANYLDQILSNPHSGIPKPAAILIEPVQGEGGNIVPAEGFLEKVIEIARRHDVLVIFDEIQSGFFRTGKFLSFQHTKAFPDIITLSKGLGGVGLPISALVYKKDIESWGPGDHIGTFRSNQASIAGGNGAFSFVKKFGVRQHVTEISEYLMARLNELALQSDFVGDVRGRGLLIGVEFVKDKSSKEPYPELLKRLRQKCLAKGVLFETGGYYGNVLRLVPALIINREIVDNALSVLEQCLGEVTEEELTEKHLM